MLKMQVKMQAKRHLKCEVNMRYISKEDFICTYHKIILEDCKKILKRLDSDDDINEGLVNEIILCTKYALKSGKRMERRLYQYHDTIEGLGYQRKRKIKKTSEPKLKDKVKEL